MQCHVTLHTPKYEHIFDWFEAYFMKEIMIYMCTICIWISKLSSTTFFSNRPNTLPLAHFFVMLSFPGVIQHLAQTHEHLSSSAYL